LIASIVELVGLAQPTLIASAINIMASNRQRQRFELFADNFAIFPSHPAMRGSIIAEDFADGGYR
jgi:hypothetical protein